MEEGVFFGQENSEDLKGQDAPPSQHPYSGLRVPLSSGSGFAMEACEGHAFSILCYPVFRAWA